MERVGFYKTQFNRQLNPLKVMLIRKKTELSKEDWLTFVNATKTSILNKPEEYLGVELPANDVIKVAVEIIFKEFIARESSNRMN